MIVIEKRPKHGCARCAWWKRPDQSENGQCNIHGMHTYYKHAACEEYEMIDVSDEITVDV